MKKSNITYQEYVREVETVFFIARREPYYYFLLNDLFKSILDDELLVPVWDNKGYKDNSINPTHNKNTYADSRSLQDMIITPLNYLYEDTVSPYITIEVKKPVLSNYKVLQIEDHAKQLEAQFEYCDYIIFTDCVTWYFLHKNKDQNFETWLNSDLEKEKHSICLIENKQWCQLEYNHSVNKRMGNIDSQEPKKWLELLTKIRNFIDDSKKGH